MKIDPLPNRDWGLELRRDRIFMASGPSRIPVWQWLIPMAATVVFVVTCRLASSRDPFWLDEILTKILLSSPSYRHMIGAVAEGVDASPPFYWSVMWVWTYYAGHSDFALRLFSALATGVAFTASWLLARRISGFWAATAACIGVFFFNEQVFTHAVECRHYPLVMALLAFALLQFDRIARRMATPPADLLVYALLVALLVLTHLFGFLFTGALLAALIVSDASHRLFRPFHYLATILGWLAFTLWIPSFHRQLGIAKPWYWIEKPSFTVLFDPETYLFGLEGLFVVAVLVVSTVLYIRARRAGAPFALGFMGKLRALGPLPLAGVTLVVLVPATAWGISQVTTSIWVERYQMPAVLGWVIVLSLALQITADAVSGGPVALAKGRRVTWVLAIALAALAVAAVRDFYHRAEVIRPTRQNINTISRHDRPTATQLAMLFLYYSTYQPGVECYYVLDWPSVLHGKSAGYVADYNIMVAVKKYFPQYRVIPSSEFLSRFGGFYYINRENTSWIDGLAANPSYRVKPLGPNAYQVDRLPGALPSKQ